MIKRKRLECDNFMRIRVRSINLRGDPVSHILGNLVGIIIGGIFFLVGIWMCFKTLQMYNKEKEFITTYGIVIETDAIVIDDKTRYKYIVEYEVDGNTYICSSTSSTYISIGSEFEVIYNPDDPRESEIHLENEYLTTLISGGIFAFLGAGAAVVSIVSLKKYRKYS